MLHLSYDTVTGSVELAKEVYEGRSFNSAFLPHGCKKRI